MRRYPLSLVVAAAALGACGVELPTEASAPMAIALQVSGDNVRQGQCIPVVWAPFLDQVTGDTIGTFTTYADDYNLYAEFRAFPGWGFTRTSLGQFESAIQDYIPLLPSGLVDFEHFPLQTTRANPVSWIAHRYPMDRVNEMLWGYASLPRVVINRLGTGIKQAQWVAGSEIFWMDEPLDPDARHVFSRVENCGPRVNVIMDLDMFLAEGLHVNADFAFGLSWIRESPTARVGPRLPRQSGYPSTVMFERGHGSQCWADGSCDVAALSALRDRYLAIGSVDVAETFAPAGSLTDIPPRVQLLFLFLPREQYQLAEINALKQFVAEGGRIVFVADAGDRYSKSGRATLDRFLRDMGSTAVSSAGSYDCSQWTDIPLAGIATHRLTAGIPAVRTRCAGGLLPDPRDFVLFKNAAGRSVTGASVAVSTTPVAAAPH